MRRMLAIVVLSGAVLAAGILVILNALRSPDACLCCYTLAGSASAGPVVARTGRDPHFLWMSDGQQILYQDQGGEIFIVKPGLDEGAEWEQLVGIRGNQPSLSADGRYLALSTETGDAASGDTRQLTETPGIHESLPLWSPRGDMIAYLSFENENWFLNVMAEDGTGQVKLKIVEGR